MKHCNGCERDLSLSQFASHIRNKDGKQTQCKDCINKKTRRWWNRVGKQRYRGKRRGRALGLTYEQVQEMLAQANSKCACCGRVTTSLLLDHNHQTGCVRGLVCNSCNVGIGHIERDGFLELAQAYLLRYSAITSP